MSAMNQVQQRKTHPVTKEVGFKQGFWQMGQIKVTCSDGKPFLLIFMEKILLFLFVAFGDFRNQVEPFSSSWECPILGQEQTGFWFFCLFLSSI